MTIKIGIFQRILWKILFPAFWLYDLINFIVEASRTKMDMLEIVVRMNGLGKRPKK